MPQYSPPLLQPASQQVPVYNSYGVIVGYKTEQTGTGATSVSAVAGSPYNPGLTLQTPLVNGRPATPLPTITPQNPNPSQYANPSTTTTAGSQPLVGGGLITAGTPPGTTTSAPNPNANFTLLNQTKNPAIASAASTTLDNENQLATSETKNFNQYFAEAQAAQGQQAQDVAGDTSTLQALPGQTAAALNATNSQFANSAANANSQYANLNQQNAATVAGDVAQLGTLDSNYITNSQAALNAGLAQAGGAINARSINPSGSAGASSDYQQALLATNAQANLELQQNLSNMQIQQLTGYVTPLQQQLYGQNVAQVQYGQQLAQTIAGMQTGSAEQIAALTQAVAGRPASEAQALLSSLNLPLQVQQQVMASLTGPINALTSADQQNQFYGLSANYGYGPVASTNYSTSPAGGGGYSPPAYANPRQPAPNVSIGPQTMGASGNAYTNPSTTSTGAPGAAAYTYGTPQYYNAVNAMQNQYGANTNQAGNDTAYNLILQQQGLRFDPVSGQMVSLTPGTQYTPPQIPDDSYAVN